MTDSSRRKTRKSPSRYQHPIPSRDELLTALERGPLTLEAIGKQFDIHTDAHRRALETRLNAMVRDGQVIRNRARQYCLTGHLDLVVGKVQAHRDGYGFLIPDDGSEDLYLSAAEMRALWDGDRAAVHVRESRRGGREGQVAEILARGTSAIVGRFARERGIEFVVPLGESQTEVLIGRGAGGGASPGDIVRAEITQHPTARTHAIGKVVSVLGPDGAPGIDTQTAILSHGLPFEWPGPVADEVAGIPDHVTAAAKGDREDLRSLPLVTIDGADAKDFDDAVYCEPQRDGWRLIVAIADVAHYVRPDTALDREARARGTSVYFPDRVLPMLPEALSNGLCSLNPSVDRLCLCCEMHVSRRGEVTQSRFLEAVMRSAARLTYTESWELLQTAHPRGKHAGLRTQLEHLLQVHEAFAAARRRRGAIDFDLPEAKIKLDRNGRVEEVVTVERLVTHRIIEECMIAANVETAKRLRRAHIPALYRVHEPPEPERIEELSQFLRTFGLKLAPAGKLAPRDLSRLIDAVADRPEAELIETVVLRSMAQARYQARNVGHFGLALAAYSHFTSPIRRYPDLLAHRAIKWLLAQRGTKGFRYPLGEMEQLGERCSLAERRADEAVWEVQEKLKCRFLESHVGDTYDVFVSGVAPFGLFVRVPELSVDGLVHVSSLPRDYYHRDASGTTLKGERSGASYRLMDRLDVKLASVDVAERKINFVLKDATLPARPARRAARGGRRGR
jgi:ribonuclease R